MPDGPARAKDGSRGAPSRRIGGPRILRGSDHTHLEAGAAVKGDPKARAEALEAACEWDKAAALWDRLAARGDPDAGERGDRARRATAMIEELCDLADLAIGARDLEAACEPLKAASALAPDRHPRVKRVRRRWRVARAELLKKLAGVKGAPKVVYDSEPWERIFGIFGDQGSSAAARELSQVVNNMRIRLEYILE